MRRATITAAPCNFVSVANGDIVIMTWIDVSQYVAIVEAHPRHALIPFHLALVLPLGRSKARQYPGLGAHPA